MLAIYFYKVEHKIYNLYHFFYFFFMKFCTQLLHHDNRNFRLNLVKKLYLQYFLFTLARIKIRYFCRKYYYLQGTLGYHEKFIKGCASRK